jgi:hypothetical protein
MRAQHLNFEGPTRGELMLAAWVELGWKREHEGLTRADADAKISKLKLTRGQYKLSHRSDGKQEVWSIWLR